MMQDQWKQKNKKTKKQIVCTYVNSVKRIVIGISVLTPCPQDRKTIYTRFYFKRCVLTPYARLKAQILSL